MSETHGADVVSDAQGPTDAEKLAALEMYVKTLKEETDRLRARLPGAMAAIHTERVGAYLPDGTKMASVTLNEGRRSAKVTDDAAALRWCLKAYPEEVQAVQIVRPAFLKMLLDIAKAEPVGGPGVDPRTGEALPFIEVTQGDPFVSVTTTAEGVARMRALAHGFAGMLEAPPAPKAGPGQGAQYDPGFADRLENGAYER